MSPLVALPLYESRNTWLVRPDDVTHIMPSPPYCSVTMRDGTRKLVHLSAREVEARLWPTPKGEP